MHELGLFRANGERGEETATDDDTIPKWEEGSAYGRRARIRRTALITPFLKTPSNSQVVILSGASSNELARSKDPYHFVGNTSLSGTFSTNPGIIGSRVRMP